MCSMSPQTPEYGYYCPLTVVVQFAVPLPLQSELCLFLLVLNDLTDGLPGGRDALFDGQVWVKVRQVLVLLRGRCLITVLCF